MLGIRDILVRIRIRIQLRIRLLSSFDFKVTKTKNFIFFPITCPQAHQLQSEKFSFLLEFCIKILFCRQYFSQLNTFMRKGKDPGPDPYPHLWLTDPDLGAPKTCGSCRSRSSSGSGSPTLRQTKMSQSLYNRIFQKITRIYLRFLTTYLVTCYLCRTM